MNWVANFVKPFARAMAALSPGCRQASRLQSEALDHKVPILQRVGLWMHLLLCKWCRRYGRQVRFLHDAAREHTHEGVDPARHKLSHAARERMKQRLRAEEEQGSV